MGSCYSDNELAPMCLRSHSGSLFPVTRFRSSVELPIMVRRSHVSRLSKKDCIYYQRGTAFRWGSKKQVKSLLTKQMLIFYPIKTHCTKKMPCIHRNTGFIECPSALCQRLQRRFSCRLHNMQNTVKFHHE